MDDTGYGIINIQNYRNQTKTIRNEIFNVLGLKPNIIEIVRPTKIPNGLKFIINIHLTLIQSREIDYQQLLNKCQQSGILARSSNQHGNWNRFQEYHPYNLWFRNQRIESKLRCLSK